jgi:hypothetical protein
MVEQINETSIMLKSFAPLFFTVMNIVTVLTIVNTVSLVCIIVYLVKKRRVLKGYNVESLHVNDKSEDIKK